MPALSLGNIVHSTLPINVNVILDFYHFIAINHIDLPNILIQAAALCSDGSTAEFLKKGGGIPPLSFVFKEGSPLSFE